MTTRVRTTVSIGDTPAGGETDLDSHEAALLAREGYVTILDGPDDVEPQIDPAAQQRPVTTTTNKEKR